ncbi:putative metalloprotease CJM1_0395 family protein [Glaciecola petra]|uniref:Metalloprotease CJM1_0395 family protein n=1 Tax=Glaciecola petra TaxID=3075602 RepID=A0ABU2ZRA4_9ALTE|nr:putative metalloprotease CJM1_0395 family protein [Aestuariibacter sp. P117]MDT0595152.1 putative metalloprotease CJM1_0395 family protein [Aestuariibacter sp. P117]
MNVILPFDAHTILPQQEARGTAEAKIDNNAKNIIEGPQQASSSKASANSFENKSTNDKVSLSPEALKQSQSQEKTNSTELSEDEEKQVQQLKDRDREVRIHEQAHAAVGGQYAGSPSYTFETGPDGKRYAVGGEVSIDVAEEEKPEDTIQKMQIVRAAALAPAEPSTQDLKVAAEASQKEMKARAEVGQAQIQPNKTEAPAEQNTALKTQNSINQYNKVSQDIVSQTFTASA